MKKISIAIPTYNSSKFIIKALQYILDDERVDDIVVHDDASTDFEQLKTQISTFNSPKIKILGNEQNQKAFTNKSLAVKNCKNDWVILLDSDNIITKNYIDTIYQLVWDPNTIYVPSFAKPLLDFREFAGQTIHKGNLQKFAEHKKAFALMNDGNYFLKRSSYLAVYEKITKDNYLSILDVLYFNTHWILQGNSIEVVEGLNYFHRHHKNSFFMRNKDKSADIIQKMRKLISLSLARNTFPFCFHLKDLFFIVAINLSLSIRISYLLHFTF